MSFLLTQCTPGDDTLRIVELALAVNAEMERRGRERYRILVPWFGGDAQRRALNETFGSANRRNPDEIFLDERLGRIYGLFFNTEIGYAASIAMWVSGWEDAGRQVRAHYSSDVVVTNLDGQRLAIGQPNIALELNRSPRFHIGIALAYQTTPYRRSRLFEQMLSAPIKTFTIGRDLILSAQKIAVEIERNLCRTFLSIPGTFTGPQLLTADTLEKDLVPPNVPLPAWESMTIPPDSVYVSVPELGPVDIDLRSALRWEMPVYTNDPERLGGGHYAAIGLLRHDNIAFHVARADWAGLHVSLRCEKPLLAASFNQQYDPEIYFNNERGWKWGLAQIAQNEPIKLQRARLDAMVDGLKALNQKLCVRFGSLDGTAITAGRIVEDILQ